MKVVSTFLKGLLTVAIVASFATLSSEAQVKRVLHEEGTGAWCGWCTDGAFHQERMLEKYENLVGVAIHNADAMALPEDNEFAPYRSGFPCGAVDRASFADVGGQVFHTRGNFGGTWENHIIERLAAKPAADVYINWTYDEGSRSLEVTMSTFLSNDMDEDVRFNVYVVEDHVVGSGNGYDQANYLSGRAGYENTPYYSQPGTITGYDHRRVVRAFLGGAFGEEGSIPMPAAGNTLVQKTFTYSVPASFDIDELYIVGTVNRGKGNLRGIDILNCSEMKHVLTGTQDEVPEKGLYQYQATLLCPPVVAVGMDETFTAKIVFENYTTTETYDVTQALNSASMPAGWSVTTDVPSSTTIGPGERKEFEVQVTTDGEQVLGQFSVDFDKVGEANAAEDVYTVIVVAKEIEHVNINVDFTQQSSVTPSLESAGYNNYVEMHPAIATAIATDMTNLKSVIVNCGVQGVLNAESMAAITFMVNSGVNVAVFGEYQTHVVQNSAAFLALFGATYNEFNAQEGTFQVQGVAGDEITGTLASAPMTVNVQSYIAAKLGTVAGGEAILVNPNNASEIRGTRREDGTKRVWLSFFPNDIASAAQRNQLVGKIAEYLQGAAGPSPAQISVDETELDFGDVALNSSEELTLEVSNVGDEVLEITQFEMLFGSTTYKVVEPASLPVSVESGQSITVTVEFTPDALGSVDEVLGIHSNSNSENLLLIDLTGAGSAVSVKETGVAEANTMTLKAGPNPFADESVVTFEVLGEVAQNVALTVVDSRGSEVANLFEGTVQPGAHVVNLNGANLSSGTYFLQLKNAHETLTLTVVRK